ncbi:hypothetical protein GC175_00910 [bacterium]|nr:hypothetical protein [bacterium]
MMARVAAFSFALLVLVALGILGASLVRHNLDALEVKRAHSQRLAMWSETTANAADTTEDESPLQMRTSLLNEPSSPLGSALEDPCAFLPWLADFPQLAPHPIDCTPHEFTDQWTARQSWTMGDVETACTLWQRWDAWGDPLQLLNESVSAAHWDNVAALLACLESWIGDSSTANLDRRLPARTASAYRSLGDAVGLTDVDTALAAYAAADRWDPNQSRQGASATARLLAQNGDLDDALALLQAQAADTNLTVPVRYRLWLEAGGLAANVPERASTAQDAFDAARQLQPDQIEPYTRLAALYRNSRPQWSIAAVQAGLDSPVAQTAPNRRTLLRLLGDLQRSQAEWEAAACAYQAALAEPVAGDNERSALQQALNEMEARLGRAARCD